MLRKTQKSACNEDNLHSLYLEFLKRFYEDGDRKQARKLATRLEQALASSPDDAAAIRGDEIRSLLAELRGDFAEAARCRETEIRRILELHSLVVNTPSWDYVSRRYDFSDVSDRLDLLALLYDKQGDLDRAIATLIESRDYCQSHKIPFDGREILEELEQDRTQSAARKAAKIRSARRAG